MNNTYQLENAEVLQRYDYTMFKETATAQYWKSPIGTTAVVQNDGSWKHSGLDTVSGLMPSGLFDRLLKYHHRMVPKV